MHTLEIHVTILIVVESYQGIKTQKKEKHFGNPSITHQNKIPNLGRTNN